MLSSQEADISPKPFIINVIYQTEEVESTIPPEWFDVYSSIAVVMIAVCGNLLTDESVASEKPFLWCHLCAHWLGRCLVTLYIKSPAIAPITIPMIQASYLDINS